MGADRNEQDGVPVMVERHWQEEKGWFGIMLVDTADRLDVQTVMTIVRG